MSYTHIRVSKAVKQTQEIVAGIKDVCAREGKADIGINYKGIPLASPELLKYMTAVQKQFRGVEFYVMVSSQTSWNSQLALSQRYVDVVVAYPDDEYALGRIGYGDYNRGESTDNKFMVYSRTIKNERYAINNSQYNMLLTADMTRAIKNAAANLRRYKPQELGELTSDDFYYKAIAKQQDAHNDEQDTFARVMDSKLLIAELLYLNRNNHAFQSSLLGEHVANWASAWEAKNEETQRTIPCVFVQIHMQGDEQWASIMEIPNIKNRYWEKGTPVSRMKTSELPENIMGKLSVLSLLQKKEYVSSVGMRVGETAFWIEV
ncbi:MAG: hypothetical protein EBR82_40340 [Caulobacteraceae bacterium]|nr:hypothetical protein [Caulobacteraceae bacterium]